MKNFFEHIKLKYGVDACSLLKSYCRETKKLAKQNERLKFLLQCRKIGITPTHILNSTKISSKLFKTAQITQEFHKIEYKFHSKLLNLEIKETNSIIKTIKIGITNKKQQLRATLNDKEYDDFIKNQNNRYKHIISLSHQTHSTKIQGLKKKKLDEYNLKINPTWFINNTNITFSDESKWLLSLGPKFAIPINGSKFSTINLIADLEQWVQTLTDDREKDLARTKIANRILTHKRTYKNDQKEKFIINIFEETKRHIKRHENEIIITKSDKGNKTVVIYKNDYKMGMERLLEDKTTYKTIREDPTQKLQRENNKIANIWNANGESFIPNYRRYRT
ncbi:uncharacterized protein LOC142229805 [Haematobia irritans]|uniref:uncharacterized protein LOC142229805 n=1 Tax=Haematobia irritans TaxID=7368 RepID=UPI003F4F65F7